MSRTSRTLWAAKLAGRTVVPLAAPPPTALTGRRFEGTLLGIDPSLRGSGLAIMDVRSGGNYRLLHTRTLRLRSSLAMAECLGEILMAVNQAIDAHAPAHVALEQTIYVQNFQTAQILGAARGAAIAAAAARGLPVFEYPPLRVKQAVCGFGRASKEQVIRQMTSLLSLPADLPSDEADATAVALCHALTWRGEQ